MNYFEIKIGQISKILGKKILIISLWMEGCLIKFPTQNLSKSREAAILIRSSFMTDKILAGLIDDDFVEFHQFGIQLDERNIIFIDNDNNIIHGKLPALDILPSNLAEQIEKQLLLFLLQGQTSTKQFILHEWNPEIQFSSSMKFLNTFGTCLRTITDLTPLECASSILVKTAFLDPAFCKIEDLEVAVRKVFKHFSSRPGVLNMIFNKKILDESPTREIWE